MSSLASKMRANAMLSLSGTVYSLYVSDNNKLKLSSEILSSNTSC